MSLAVCFESPNTFTSPSPHPCEPPRPDCGYSRCYPPPPYIDWLRHRGASSVLLHTQAGEFGGQGGGKEEGMWRGRRTSYSKAEGQPSPATSGPKGPRWTRGWRDSIGISDTAKVFRPPNACLFPSPCSPRPHHLAPPTRPPMFVDLSTHELLWQPMGHSHVTIGHSDVTLGRLTRVPTLSRTLRALSSLQLENLLEQECIFAIFKPWGLFPKPLPLRCCDKASFVSKEGCALNNVQWMQMVILIACTLKNLLFCSKALLL